MMNFDNLPDMMSHYNLGTNLVHNNKEVLLLAYSVLITPELFKPECTFINGNPSQFDKEYVLPRDTYSRSYGNGNKVPAWKEFYETNKQFDTAIQIVFGCNEKDTERGTICLLSLDSSISSLFPPELRTSTLINFSKNISSKRVDKYCELILNTYHSLLLKN